MANPPVQTAHSTTVPADVNQRVLQPFEKHGWSVTIHQGGSCTKLSAHRENITVRIAVLNSSSAISNAEVESLATQYERIFYCEPPTMMASKLPPVTISAEPLSEFFPYLVSLNMRIESDKSPAVTTSRPKIVKRLVAESPLQSVYYALSNLRAQISLQNW